MYSLALEQPPQGFCFPSEFEGRSVVTDVPPVGCCLINNDDKVALERASERGSDPESGAVCFVVMRHFVAPAHVLTD